MKCSLEQRPLQTFTLQMSDRGSHFHKESLKTPASNCVKTIKYSDKGKCYYASVFLVGLHVTSVYIRRHVTTVPEFTLFYDKDVIWGQFQWFFYALK